MEATKQISQCNVCGPYEVEDISHDGSNRHLLNFLLKYRAENRSKFVNYTGILLDQEINLVNLKNVDVTYNEKKGIYFTSIKNDVFKKLKCKLEYNFMIKNENNFQCLVQIEKLYPLEKYSLSNELHSSRDKLDLTLRKGEYSRFKLTFIQQDALNGCYELPIGITIQPLDETKGPNKTLYRDVKINICNEFTEDDDTQSSPFLKGKWPKNMLVYEPTKIMNQIINYPIPTTFVRTFLYAFKGFNGETLKEQEFRLETKNMWKETISEKNYANYFHRLLWLEEVTNSIGLEQYNMSKVPVELFEMKGVLLKVPGLAEKRPSVIQGDFVSLRRADDDCVAYRGIVERVEDELLRIEHLHPQFLEIVRADPNALFDVSFCLSRLILERMHKAVDNCVKKGMLLCLFPKPSNLKFIRKKLVKEDLFNPLIYKNEAQLTAVESILSATSKRAPYIIYGPPGTGKTVTLVEAILQIKKNSPFKRILVCAPSNAACDMLASKLNEQLPTRQTTDLFRVHSVNRNLMDIPDDIKEISNVKDGKITQVKHQDLSSYSIVISTLHLIGRYSETYSPDMVFIDEAAQATEPECDIPLSLISPNVQIVLAGDPKQLGPVSSKLSTKNGLGISLLERLMNTNSLYAPIRKIPLLYDNDYIIMLTNNYRSHKELIQIPNELFYDRALTFFESKDVISKMSIAAKIMKKKKGPVSGSAIEFIGISSKEQRNGNSPSYYNDMEIGMVVKLIKTLMNLDNCPVVPSDIGVIAPYIRQVVKIRNSLTRLSLKDIQVGTTETFQGCEKRIMIISTVRAQSDLLRYDKKYDLGFVKNKRRFNVAITRAKAKLIIVGNPVVLGYDKECWDVLLNYCLDLNSYFGMEYVPRTDEVVHRLNAQLSRTHLH